jgi:phenylacetate-CoA ligase
MSRISSLLLRKVARDCALAEIRLRTPPVTSPDSQLRCIRDVWADCLSDVPYYQRLVESGRAPQHIRDWRAFAQIPVLRRQEFQEHPQLFVRRSGSARDQIKTAGSTGTPIRFGVWQTERDLMRIVKLAIWRQFGYVTGSRLFLIWGHSHLLGTGWRGHFNHARRKAADWLLGYRRVDAYRLSPDMCHTHAEALLRFRPLGLIGYASALDLFVRHTREFHDAFRELGLRFVLSTSEMAPKEDSFDLISQTFHCPVIQEYGGAEFGQVAIDLGKGRFDVFGDLNYVECEASDNTNRIQPILITSLYRRYVPLIRYHVGDALEEPEILENGHVSSFGRLAGRVNDVIRMRDGSFIHSVAIFHCIHQESAVHNIQMVLRDEGIEVRLAMADARFDVGTQHRIRSRLAQVHPSLGNVVLTAVSDLQTNRAGKRQWFVDERSSK